ncbi:MAG: Rieske 2Fe-2S domain-containing protein [Acidimicrobiia bacterium]|nr:Rieske 2Fe-2S domain-containing protein [Acidimicrobiia bacterium]
MTTEPSWTPLVTAAAVEPGGIVDAELGDIDVVVWRAATGRLCVMDARCPHQWSHLGAEGVVDGDEIVCCAHGWRFELDGSGWKQNMAGRRDRKSDIDVFACDVRDGTVWATAAPPATSEHHD